jgi:hypothetical protein
MFISTDESGNLHLHFEGLVLRERHDARAGEDEHARPCR